MIKGQESRQWCVEWNPSSISCQLCSWASYLIFQSLSSSAMRRQQYPFCRSGLRVGAKVREHLVQFLKQDPLLIDVTYHHSSSSAPSEERTTWDTRSLKHLCKERMSIENSLWIFEPGMQMWESFMTLFYNLQPDATPTEQST